jgi:ureidoacrylate peracid hydrolase
MSAALVVRAEPEDVTFDRSRTAVLVVDMQNAFASAGGMLDLAGVDVAPAAEAVENTFLVIEAARRAGIPVVYLTIGYPPDESTAGGPDSPNPRKELALKLMRERPELRGKLLTFGTWDFEIVDRLRPRPGDAVIVKSRYSGFHGTELDSWLRSRGLRNLIVTGIASNVCVESTIRDAYFLEYWPLMVEDASMPAGSRAIHDATLFNVRTFFGWTALAEDVAAALGEVAAARS